MHLSQLKSDRVWRSTIGMSEAKFRAIVPLFEQAYQAHYEVYIDKKQKNLKQQFVFQKQNIYFFTSYSVRKIRLYMMYGR